MARRFAENGWKLGVRFDHLKDNGIKGRDGYTLVVELGDTRIKFHLDDEDVAQCVKNARRGSLIVLGGIVARERDYLRYKVYKIAPAKDEAEGQVNWARLSGKVTRQGTPRETGEGRDKCSVNLVTAGTHYSFIAYDGSAGTAETLKGGDEVAIDMHFVTVPVDPRDPDSTRMLRLEIDRIEVEPEVSEPQATGGGS